jgi:hypothetical protein
MQYGPKACSRSRKILMLQATEGSEWYIIILRVSLRICEIAIVRIREKQRMSASSSLKSSAYEADSRRQGNMHWRIKLFDVKLMLCHCENKPRKQTSKKVRLCSANNWANVTKGCVRHQKEELDNESLHVIWNHMQSPLRRSRLMLLKNKKKPRTANVRRNEAKQEKEEEDE